MDILCYQITNLVFDYNKHIPKRIPNLVRYSFDKSLIIFIELKQYISTQLEIFNKTAPFINYDFYLYRLITKFKIKCSSLPIVPSGRFDSVNGAIEK